MKRLLMFVGLCCAIAPGCATPRPPCGPTVPACHQYQAPGFDWSLVRRIVLVPLTNNSSYPHVTFEMHDSLAARMQCNGRFEVIPVTPGECAARCNSVRVNGTFDEAELLQLADAYNADAVLFGAITQYEPYTPPRVGLSLRLISPADGAVFASVDGLWDARDQTVAEQARCYSLLALNKDQSLLGCDIAIDSPSLFRRFACQYAIEALVSPVPQPIGNMSTGTIQPASAVGGPLQPQPMRPGDPTFPPPLPPADPSAIPPDPAATLPAQPVDLPGGPLLPVEPAA